MRKLLMIGKVMKTVVNNGVDNPPEGGETFSLEQEKVFNQKL